MLPCTGISLFLQQIYIYRFLDAFKLIGVLFALYFSTIGLTTIQIAFLIGIWSVTQIICEVPFGVISDKYPRKSVLIAAQILQAIAFILWLSHTYIGFALGFVLWGFKNALTSGTLEALIYDELSYLEQNERYEHVNGMMESIFWVSVAASAIIGGWSTALGYDFLIYASIVSIVLSIIPLSLTKSIKPKKSTGESEYFTILKKAVKELIKNKKLLVITLFFCTIFPLFASADEWWALIYKQLKISDGIIGILISLGYGIFIVAGYMSRYMNGTQGIVYGFWLLVISGLLLCGSFFTSSMFSIPIMFLGMFFLKIAHLKFDAQFQHFIDTSERATITSLKSLIFEVVYFILVIFTGWVASVWSPLHILFLQGTLIVILTLLYLPYRKVWYK
ncbi:MAG: MFS transporter [Candidatus Roizmanbacteria bacterium]